MRLWDYRLIPVLPNKMLVSQWRECIGIKRQWEKGTLKHRLVSYVMDYDKCKFNYFVALVIREMEKRNIKYKESYAIEIREFCKSIVIHSNYPEHNDRYLRQCLYNLEEKAMRGIITKEEWEIIYNKFKDFTNLWNGKEHNSNEMYGK